MLEKESLNFFLNGREVNLDVEKIKSFTLLDLLRNELHLTGVKRGCSEGDCGACTVVIGEYSPIYEKVIYKTITSCIYPLFKVDGKHVITIEGIEENGNLHPIQKSFIDHHAIQCGFCTPGMIMSLFGLFLENPSPSEKEITKALSGNLCRCTGYKTIKEAALDINGEDFQIPSHVKKVEEKIYERYNLEKGKTKKFRLNKIFPFREYISPHSLKDLFREISKGNYKIINGGSDLFVGINKLSLEFDGLIDISRIEELNFIHIDGKRIEFGAGITFHELLEKLKEFKHIFEIIGSNQIRKVGTMGGNIANGSPIADGAVFLLSMDAILTLEKKDGKRVVPLKEFYQGYKKFDLKEGEIISKIEFTIPEGKISYLKTSKRKEVDIASVNSSLVIDESNGKIRDVKISFGGVYPYPFRIEKGERFLKGKNLEEKNIYELAKLCKEEVAPISDVRGSKTFRKELVYNHILKHFLNLFPHIFGERNGG